LGRHCCLQWSCCGLGLVKSSRISVHFSSITSTTPI
jgi:hypothetical protein